MNHPPHRTGDHVRGLILDPPTGATVLTVGVVQRVTPASHDDCWNVECRMVDTAGNELVRAYITNAQGRSDYLSTPWPDETNHSLRGEPFYPRNAHVPPVNRRNDAKPLTDIVIVARYTAGNAVWLVAEADPRDGDAFGWAELVPGGGEWGSFNLREIEALNVPTIAGNVQAYRDHAFTPNRFGEITTR